MGQHYFGFKRQTPPPSPPFEIYQEKQPKTTKLAIIKTSTQKCQHPPRLSNSTFRPLTSFFFLRETKIQVGKISLSTRSLHFFSGNNKRHGFFCFCFLLFFSRVTFRVSPDTHTQPPGGGGKKIRISFLFFFF